MGAGDGFPRWHRCAARWQVGVEWGSWASCVGGHGLQGMCHHLTCAPAAPAGRAQQPPLHLFALGTSPTTTTTCHHTCAWPTDDLLRLLRQRDVPPPPAPVPTISSPLVTLISHLGT